MKRCVLLRLSYHVTSILLLCVPGTNSFGQVNLQTGSATFSLPIFNWQHDKSRLNTAVSLSYNSGNGLKVNEVASSVGQGWNLIAGGVITRMQIGQPDDQVAHDGYGTDKYPAGYLYSGSDPSMGCPRSMARYPIFEDENHIYKEHNEAAVDRELDYFSFQMNGRSGLFILKKGTQEGVSIGDTKLKIKFFSSQGGVSGKRTAINSFEIRDENGLIYRFGINQEYGVTRVLKSDYCDPNVTQALTQPKFEDGGIYHQGTFDNLPSNKEVISSWYLSEIEDALTHFKVQFHYIQRGITQNAGSDISYFDVSDPAKKYCVISHKQSITQSQALTLISLPDGHNIDIAYSNDNRVDLAGDYPVSAITVRYGLTEVISKHVLNTKYLILNRCGYPINDFERKCARLCLVSVTKYGPGLRGGEPPYIFDYYLNTKGPYSPSNTTSPESDDIVPPPFFYMKDVWGYYNGNQSRADDNSVIPFVTNVNDLNYSQLKGLCFFRNNSLSVYNAKSDYAKNGLLRQIIYPTGGTLTYKYSKNVQGQTQSVGGVHVSSTEATDGGYSNGCGNPIVTQYQYVEESSSQSSLWGVEAPQTSMTMESHYAPEYKYFYYKPLFSFGCAYHFQYPGILSKEEAVSLTDAQKFMVALSQVLNVVSNATTLMDIITVCNAASTVAWAAVILDIIGALVEVILTCFTNHSKDATTQVYYNSDLMGLNPLPIQFRRVEVIPKNGAIGKTVFRFTHPDDNLNFALWATSNPALSMRQRYGNWIYGLPFSTTELDASGNKVHEVVNEYSSDINIIKHSLNNMSCKCAVQKSSSLRNEYWDNLSNSTSPSDFATSLGDPEIKVDLYENFTGRMELINTYDRTYKPNSTSQYLENVTSYEYNDNYQVTTITNYLSDGTVKYKDIVYNSDPEGQPYEQNGQPYFGGYGQQANTLGDKLIQKNVLNIPVRVINSISFQAPMTRGTSPVSTARKYLNEEITQLIELNTGAIVPGQIYEQRYDEPKIIQDWVSYSFINPTSITPPPAFKLKQAYVYDGSGNLTGIYDKGGRKVTNIYGYDDKFVVASVINADPAVDKLAYTSFENNDLGGWSIIGTANPAVQGQFITGKLSFDLTPSITLTSPVTFPKAYKVSFWASNSSVRVNTYPATLKSNSTVHGLSYYEFDLPGGNISTTITGNATIDELRLFPADARMRTVSYDILLGKTAECDENNRLTYYSYDELGRMKLIKDEKDDIIKMYEYKNADQKGCPAVYYNLAATVKFTRNDCGPGYVGEEVTLPTIPAGTFTSTISQADADAQLEAYINSHGQSYANTHGQCLGIFYNEQKSKDFTSHCPTGQVGGLVTYTVPAHKYSSMIDLAHANQLATDEINANGQAYANTHPNCTSTSDPIWQADDPVQKECRAVSGGAIHLFMYMTDVNPNSSTHGQQQWIDVGPSSDCQSSSCTKYRISCPPNLSFQVVYTPCGTSQQASQSWTTQIIHEYTDPGENEVGTICSSSGQPSFMQNGYYVTIPGLTVTPIGSCP